MAIAVCGYLYLMKKIRRVQEEFAKFANFPVQLVILNGTAAKKRQQIESLHDDGTLQVIVVNYESSWRLKEELLKYDADLIIADEGHKLKSGMTAQSKGMHKLGDKARYKMLLTYLQPVPLCESGYFREEFHPVSEPVFLHGRLRTT